MKEKLKNLKFKRWQKVLAIILGVLLILTSILFVRAQVQGRSATSLLLEDVFSLIPLKDRRDEAVFQEALDANSVPYELPDSTREKYDIMEYDDYTDTFVISPETDDGELVIFYLHGGGYWSQPLSLHYSFFNSISNELNAQLVLPIYPKAPAYQATEVHEMVMERYLNLVEEHGGDADNIILMGESAGGGLALSFMQVLRDKDLPMPQQAILISPWLDVTCSNPAMVEIQPHDPLLNIESLGFGGITYAGDLDPKDPLASPIYGDLDGLPPITVFTGTHDILHSDIALYEDIAKDKALDVTFHVYENQNHCFIGFPIPEGKEALGIILDILK